MNTPIRWGILGTGNIARQFAIGLADARDANLVAVGSRSDDSAAAFASTHNIPRAHSSYPSLAQDPEVDAVYVSTPHPWHMESSILLIEHGKAVLCEKPFTINARQAQAVIELARARGIFLMEAMWTRYIPAVVQARELIDKGEIGEVCMVQADFGFRAPLNPQSRLFNPALGGGALLDIGIYPLSLASMVLGPNPQEIVSTANLGETGVDEQSAVLLKYAGGQIAVCSCSLRTNTNIEATFMGTEGSIRLHSPFYKSSRLTVTRHGQQKLIDLPLTGNGYNYEAEEVGDCLRDGRTESSIMPLDETLALMLLMDRIRSQWGLRYPME